MPGLSRAVRDYRFEKMAAYLRQEDCDALALTGSDWIEWASNHHVFEKAFERPVLFIVTADGRSIGFFSELSGPAIMPRQRSGELWADAVHLYGDAPQSRAHCRWLAGQWDEMVAEVLAAEGLGSARIVADSISASLAKAAERLPGLTLTTSDARLRELRWVKHPEEIATLQTLAELSDWAMSFHREELWPGRLAAEADLAVASRLTVEIARRFPEERFETTSVFTLSGPYAACIHGANSRVDRRVLNDAVTISQISSRLNGVQMELARPWIIGKPDRTLMRYVECALDAQEAGIDAARVGRPASGIHAAAYAVMEKAGFARHFKVRSGHGIGVIMHDFPERLPWEDRPLVEGEAYAVEPGIYIEGVGGFRYSDVIVVTADAPQRITASPKGVEALSIAPALRETGG